MRPHLREFLDLRYATLPQVTFQTKQPGKKEPHSKEALDWYKRVKKPWAH